MMNRRTFFAGAAAASMPVAAVAAPVEEVPIEKANRLAHELSDVLNDYLFGSFKAIVEPSGSSKWPVLFQRMDKPQGRFDLQEWLDAQDDKSVIDFHLSRLVKALNKADPSRSYRAECNYDEYGFIVLMGDKIA